MSDEIERLRGDLEYAINALAQETTRRLQRDKFILMRGMWDDFLAVKPDTSRVPPEVMTEAERYFGLAISNPDKVDRPAPHYIGLAIADERERCASIAETTTAGPLYYVEGQPNARPVIGGDIIAAFIRETQTATPEPENKS